MRWGPEEADLKRVVGAQGLRVHLHIKGLHKVQDDMESLLQVDAVGAAGEFGVWLRSPDRAVKTWLEHRAEQSGEDRQSEPGPAAWLGYWSSSDTSPRGPSRDDTPPRG